MKTDIVKIAKRFAGDARDMLQGKVLEEYLFGSYAVEKETTDSDIDILIIVDAFTSDMQYQVSGLASEYSLEHDVLISPIVRDAESWNKNRDFNTLFYQEVTENGVRL
jgi:uncharacterized protein